MSSGYKLIGYGLTFLGATIVARAAAGAGTPTSGDLYFDNFQVKKPFSSTVFDDATVQKVHFSFDGSSTFTLATPVLVADLGKSANADGLIFAPNGNLLIGGSTTGKIEQITTSGTVVGFVNVANTNPYHLTLSPNGTTIYSGGSTSLLQGGDAPGPLGITPFFSDGAGHNISGDDTLLTQLAFDKSGHVYYTSSPDTGVGSVGTFNLATLTTTRHIMGLPAAHGITFDPFTGDLMVSGNSHITQIDPTTFNVVSDLDVSGMAVNMLDQVYVDGHGHLFAGDNGQVNIFTGVGTKGKLVFIDYSGGKHQIGDAGSFVAANPLVLALDDIAPVSALLPGDANFDGNVGFDDLVTVARHYGQSGSWISGDFDADGKTDFNDLVIVARNYGHSLTAAELNSLDPSVRADVEAAFAQVPEPSSLVLVFVPALACLRRRRLS